MKYFILLLFIALFAGCFSRPSIDPGKTYDDLDREVAKESNSTDSIEEKEKKVAELEARLAAAEADLKSAKKAEAAAKLRRLQAMAYWTAAICGAIGLLATAAFIILLIQGIHVGKKLIIGIGVAAYAVACVCLFAGKYIEYWQWLGGAVLLAGVIYGIWYLLRMVKINKEHAQVGVDAIWELMQIRDSNGDTPEVIKEQAAAALKNIKTDARLRQAKKGVHDDIKKLIRPYKLQHHLPEKLAA